MSRDPNWVCPTCGYPPMHSDGNCDNPACLANPTTPEPHKEAIRQRASEADRRRQEDDERRSFKERLRKQGFHSF